MPVITSNTKSYKRVMEECGLDFTCTSEDDWINNLRKLSDNYELRSDLEKKFIIMQISFMDQMLLLKNGIQCLIKF